MWALIITMFSAASPAYASSNIEYSKQLNVAFEVQEDSILSGATKVNERLYTNELGQNVLARTFLLEDLTRIIDTITRVDIHTVQYSRSVSNPSGNATVNISAQFQYYQDPNTTIRYVRCQLMSASYDIPSGAIVNYFIKSYDSEYKTLSAYASVSYAFTKDVIFYWNGILKIGCSANGTVLYV